MCARSGVWVNQLDIGRSHHQRTHLNGMDDQPRPVVGLDLGHVAPAGEELGAQGAADGFERRLVNRARQVQSARASRSGGRYSSSSPEPGMRWRRATTPLDLARIASSARKVSASRAGEHQHRALTHRAAASSSSAEKRAGRCVVSVSAWFGMGQLSWIAPLKQQDLA